MIFFLFTFPNPLKHLEKFFLFLSASHHNNNFQIAKNLGILKLPLEDSFRGGGWTWIVKYFFLIMPIMFTGYWLAAIHLIKISFKQPLFIFILFLSLSTPLIVEISKVAQFGRNYFPWLLGMLLVIGCSLSHINQVLPSTKPIYSKNLKRMLIVALILHIIFNGWIFLPMSFLHVWPRQISTIGLRPVTSIEYLSTKIIPAIVTLYCS